MTKFLQICQNTADKFVPTRTLFKKSKNKRIPRYRRLFMRRLSKLEKKYDLAKNSSRIEKIKAKLIDTEKLLQKSYREKKCCDATKINPKYFISHAKRIGPLFDVTTNNDVSDNKPMADILQK